MKSISVFPMSSYRNKVYGLVITVVALVLLLIVSIHGPLPFIQANADNQFNLFFAIVTFGMYMIAWSKEKNDDERVQRIRAKAMQVGFGLTVGAMMSFTFCMDIVAIKQHDETFGTPELTMFLTLGLGAYLTVFYIGLLFDPAWIYNDDTVMLNLRKNKQFFIVYFLAVIVLFALIFLFHKK